MKKLLGIVVLGLLLSGNAYAGVNEPGVTSIAGCDSGLKSVNEKFIKKHLKKLSKKMKIVFSMPAVIMKIILGQLIKART